MSESAVFASSRDATVKNGNIKRVVSLSLFTFSSTPCQISFGILNYLDFHESSINHSNYRLTLPNQATETMIEAFTRLDAEILGLENLSPGSRLTTAEAWVEHLQVINFFFVGFFHFFYHQSCFFFLEHAVERRRHDK